MNKTAIVYIVHSDLDENNIFAMFEDEVEAIMYARRHKEDLTYVDKTEMTLDEFGDYDEVLSAETIWVYDEDEDPADIEDAPELSDEDLFDIDFDELERELDNEESWFEDLDADKLVETLEENEDIVECKECFELFPKEACTKIAIGYICPECGKIHSHEEPEFEIDSIPDVVIADEDTFKIDFPEVERMNYGNDMIPDEPTPEVGPNPEPCVGPECEAPVEAPVTKEETITKLVVDEHEAIDGYEKAKIEIEANSELDEKEKEEILDTIEHIKEEEIEHIEELEELVDEVEETKVDEPAEESESEDESDVLVEEITDTAVEEPKEKVPTEEVADEEKDLDAELAKKMKQLKIAKVDTKIAKQQAKQAKHLKTATKQTNTAAKDSAKTNLTVNKKNNAVTKDTAKTDLAVTKAANDIEVDNSKTKVAVSKDDVKVAKNTLKTTKLNNKIKAITPEEETEEIISTEVEQPIETTEVETIDEALLEGFLTDILADAGAGAGIGAIGGTAGAVVGAGAGAVFAIVKNISKSIGDSFKKFKDASDVKKALKRDPQLNDTIEKLVAETGEDNAEKILHWIEDYYTRKVFDEKSTTESETEITELDVVDDFEDEFEGLEDILEEAINTNILTEANWGGFIGIGAASVEDKLDAFFSTEGGKEGKFKYNKNYGSNFELKEYNSKTKEFKDLSEADAKYINLIDNEYEQVRTAKKDAEKLSKSDGAKDKYIAVCIRAYKETDTPSIYIYQNGKLKADHSGTKIKYFEAKYDGVKDNSSNSTQRDLEDTNYAFAPAEVTFELSNLQEKEISVLKGTNNISDEKLIKTFKFGFTKGIPTNIFTFSRISLNKYKLKLVKEELDKITDESAKEKLFAAEGIKLKLIIEGKTEATCTIIIKKDNPTETPAEQPVEQPHVETTQGPTREQLKGTYRLLVALLGTKDKAAEYITVEGKGINAKYNLVQGKTFDDIKAKIKELQKGVLGESLTEHVNEEHPAIESDQELEGIDNAVVDCKVNKVIAHSEDEKPLDCEMEKVPLEKPLTEELSEDKLQVMEDYLKSTKFASLDTEWEEEGDFYLDIIGAYLDYSNRTNMFSLGLSIYHASEDNNAEYPERHTDEEEFSYDSLAEMYEDEECKEILDRLYEDNSAKLSRSISEETHAKYAKPAGDRVQAYNNALKYAKKAGKPYIYGYSQIGDGKFFALEQPVKVSSTPAEAEKEFKNRYKRCSVVYMVYPDKDFVESLEEASYRGFAYYEYPVGSKCHVRETPTSFVATNENGTTIGESRTKIGAEGIIDEYLKTSIKEELFTKEEQEEYNMDEDGNSLDSYDTYVRCGFCDEIYTKSECKYERNLGWLCPRCEAAIYSRGEKLTFVDPDEFLEN